MAKLDLLSKRYSVGETRDGMIAEVKQFCIVIDKTCQFKNCLAA